MSNHTHSHEGGCCSCTGCATTENHNSEKESCCSSHTNEGHYHDDEDPSHSCSCSHAHEHDQEHGHSHGDDCGCGHTHEHGTFKLKEQLLLGASIGIFIIAVLFDVSDIVKLALMLASTLFAGYPIFKDGVKSIFKLSFDETALMTIAVIAAFFIGEYFEAVIVTLFFRVGNLLENYAVAKSRRDIESLTKIREENTNVIGNDGSITVMPSKTIAVGTKIAVKPGEKLPIDAIVLEGTSSVDTSALTGESLARNIMVGDTLLSGMINLDGMLVCETINTFDDSAASKIIELVQSSMAKKGKTENFISRFAKIYTPFIIVSAAALAFLPPLFGFGTLETWVPRTLVFLLASCPCALVISIPLSFFAGIGASSKIGVLVKGSKYIEIISKADTIVFDKTGTLTTGKLSVSAVESVSNLTKDEILRLSAIAESYSNHPMATAVVSHYNAIPDLSAVSDFSEITGKGVSLTLSGDKIICGSHRLMFDHGIDVNNVPKANIYLSINGILKGYIVLSDTPRVDAKEALSALKSLGIKKTIMLTGDNHAAAQKIQAECGVDEFFAELLPIDKVSHLEKIKATSSTTLFVGDGINDAPVLAMADAGIAMGFGTDAAIEASDVVLLSDNLGSLPKAIAISKRTMSIAKFNIVFALTVKAVVLSMGALGLASMWMAIVADVGVSVLSVMNATRILTSKK